MQHDHKNNKLRRALHSCQEMWGRTSSLRAWILKHAGNDKQLLVIIFALALLTRVPFIGHPDRTVFDEVIYSEFALHIIDEAPVFDIHPPLVRMVFAGIANNTAFLTHHLPLETNAPYYDFPYTRVRLFVALIGSLFPLIIYGIGRMIGFAPRAALVPALFVVFDNALVLYSRTILPDMLLLLVNFLALACALALAKATRTRDAAALIILTGIFSGMAFSIKWTALGVIALALLYLLWKRKWAAIVIIPAIIAATYVVVFALYLSGFRAGGTPDPLFPAFDTPIVRALDFPKGNDLNAVMHSIPELNDVMVHANGDPDLEDLALRAPKPYAWPAARSSILFWVSDDGEERIELKGNSVLWILVFFVFLFEIGWMLVSFITSKRWQASEAETLLVIGYLMNYFPFFLIGRSMYPYHYFTALVFLYLLTPFVVPRILHCIRLLSRDRYIGLAVITLSAFLIVINFFLLAKNTYGF